MTDKEKIIAEIERRKKLADKQEDNGYFAARSDAYAELLNFIDSIQEEPVSEDLIGATNIYCVNVRKGYPRVMDETDRYICNAFKAGAKWQKEQFEKNRLKHCNSITIEQAGLEQGFIDQHLDKHNRMPTFLDAIEYGMRLQKEQMMSKAVDGLVVCSKLTHYYKDIAMKIPSYLNVDDEVKVIIIKEE